MMMKRFLYLLLFFPLLLQAQNSHKKAELFCTNDYNGQKMIRVKWICSTVYNPAGMDVYRQEKGATEWTKLNTTPVVPLNALPANNKLDKEAKSLFNSLHQSKFEEFSKNPMRVFVLIKSFYSDELAGYIGITWLDEKVENGKEYTYKILIAGTQEDLGISKPIVSGPYAKITPPEEPRLKRYKKRVDISWKPDLYRYYAVDIYKKSEEETVFKKVNKIPRAIQKDQADAYSDKAVYFQDTAIVYSANYTYRLVALDYFGQASEMSTEITAPSADFIPPAMPYDLVPTPSSLKSAVRLDWKVVDEKDLAGVNIYTGETPDTEFKKINAALVPKTQLSYDHGNLSTGGHYYKVSTVDNGGNETFSAPVFVEIRDLTPPAQPQGLTSEAGEGFIKLSWKANSESDLLGYHIQRSIKSNSKINSSYVNVTKEAIKQTNYTEELSKNVRNEFVYRIVAIDTNFNRSVPSANTLATMPDVSGPMEPVIKNVVSDSTKAVITWLPNVDIDLAGYNLFRQLGGDSMTLTKVNYNLIPSGVVIYNDRGLKQGTGYDYFLEALDSSGNKSRKSSSFFTKTISNKKTGNIRLLTTKYNVRKEVLALEWKADANEEIKGVVIYRQPSAELPFKAITGLIPDDHIDVPLAKDKTTGLFQLRCYTVSGEIIKSENFKTPN
jgi:hypothetical protein